MPPAVNSKGAARCRRRPGKRGTADVAAGPRRRKRRGGRSVLVVTADLEIGELRRQECRVHAARHSQPDIRCGGHVDGRGTRCRPGRPVRGKITGEFAAPSDQPQPDRSGPSKRVLPAVVEAPGLGRDCRNSVLSALSSMKALRESAFSVSRIITPAFENFRKSSRLASLTRMSTSPVIC